MPPKYSFKQSINIEGHNRGSFIALTLEGLKFILKSAAGYATYIPLGIGRLFLSIYPIKEQARLPPAESPAK